MIVRVNSSRGTKRIEVSEQDSVSKLLNKIQSEFSLNPHESWYLSRQRGGADKLKTSGTIKTMKIKHGDMLYLSGDALSGYVNGSANTTTEAMDIDGGDLETDSIRPTESNNMLKATTSAGGVGYRPTPAPAPSIVVEDAIDIQLDKEDGRIIRKKNEQLCRHGPSGKCIHCVPLEPYDETYLEHCDPPIKFMSFHAYLRKLRGGANKGKFMSLENLSCHIKPGCKEHLPWPDGICTKCQPNAVTLSTQKYRHVDYTQFENRSLMERFLDYWRKTGHQRIGFLYGRYAPFENSPLGIKAIVSAIYEPPQVTSKKSVRLLITENDESEQAVKRVADGLGLTRVGWIFTDLVADNLKTGTVKHYRGTIDTFFLSAQECITAAHFQNMNPSPCKHSSEGHFGSKFVTVVVTGDETNQIHFEGYQVSNQCMALVGDNCLVPTYDAAELGYIRESTNEQYVPDVFYTMKDKYSNEVTHLGRPLPVEYLLIDMPAAFPKDEEDTLAGPVHTSLQYTFPVENRTSVAECQDFNAFTRYMRQFPPAQNLHSVSNFHVLLYLSTEDMLPVSRNMPDLLIALKEKDEVKAQKFFDSEEWRTVLQLMEHSHDIPMSQGESSNAGASMGHEANYSNLIGGAGTDVSGGGSASGGVPWPCVHCTFLNQADHHTCDMCGLPQS